jgi:hypothetical protein
MQSASFNAGITTDTDAPLNLSRPTDEEPCSPRDLAPLGRETRRERTRRPTTLDVNHAKTTKHNADKTQMYATPQPVLAEAKAAPARTCRNA